MRLYKFIKEGRDWYIDLPEFIEEGGSKGDLQMVEGADKMLDIISQGKTEVSMAIDRVPFPGADELKLIERCDPFVGGGYYNLRFFEGNEINYSCSKYCSRDSVPNFYINTLINSLFGVFV
jgi:hypothetical protein